MRHECHPKLKTFSFSSELVLLCAKLDPAFFVRCYHVWCNVNCYFECSKCIKKSMIPLSFVIFQKIFCFISVSCYFAFDFVFSYNMAKHVRIILIYPCVSVWEWYRAGFEIYRFCLHSVNTLVWHEKRCSLCFTRLCNIRNMMRPAAATLL